MEKLIKELERINKNADDEIRECTELYGWGHCDNNGHFDQIEMNRQQEINNELYFALLRKQISEKQAAELEDKFL
jgi:hypothetical protein